MRANAHAIIDRLFAYGDNNPQRIPPLFENFMLRPGVNADRDAAAANTYATATAQLNIDKNPHFEVLGTNATSALVTHGADGGLLLTTAGASADQIIIAPHLNTGVSKWTGTQFNTDKEPAWRTIIKTGASIADVTLWAGLKLTNTGVVATDNDQVLFRYNAAVNEGRWQAIYSVGGTDYELDTGIEVEASIRYQMGVFVGPDRKPYFYIGVENEQPRVVQQGTEAVTASLTTLIRCRR